VERGQKRVSFAKEMEIDFRVPRMRNGPGGGAPWQGQDQQRHGEHHGQPAWRGTRD